MSPDCRVQSCVSASASAWGEFPEAAADIDLKLPSAVSLACLCYCSKYLWSHLGGIVHDILGWQLVRKASNVI